MALGIALTLVVALVTGTKSNGVCRRLRIENPHEDVSYAGVYYYKYHIDQKPVYEQECGVMFLYYVAKHGANYWLLGPYVTRPSGYALSYSQSDDPTAIPRDSWRAHSNQTFTWTQCNITLTCEDFCDNIHLEHIHLSKSMQGIYYLQENTTDVVYKHTSSDYYIYKTTENDCITWRIGNNTGGLFAYLFSKENVTRPILIRYWYAVSGGVHHRLSLRWNCVDQSSLWTEAVTTTTSNPSQTESAPVCGARQISMGAAMIIRGDDATPGKWPFAVALLKATGVLKCAGVLLNERWVLTAGHCISDEDQDQENILVGALDTGNVGEVGRLYKVRRGIKHPDFIWQTGQEFQLIDDIGLIEMDSPVSYNTYVQPACLQAEDQTLGLPQGSDNSINSNQFDVCYTLGWGEQEYKGVAGGILQDFNINAFFEKVQCVKKYFDNSYIPWVTDSETICVQSNQKARVCRGDSGAPLLCHSSGRWYVTGVASWSLSSCIAWNTNYPSVYTQLEPYRDWILNTTT